MIDFRRMTKNFLLFNLKDPDDELFFALILKNLSDRRISVDEKLINLCIKMVILEVHSNIFVCFLLYLPNPSLYAVFSFQHVVQFIIKAAIMIKGSW